MRILDKIESHRQAAVRASARSSAHADKALVLARALAWRGETLPPRTMHLVQRVLERG